jgi:hypothetical protein
VSCEIFYGLKITPALKKWSKYSLKYNSAAHILKMVLLFIFEIFALFKLMLSRSSVYDHSRLSQTATAFQVLRTPSNFMKINKTEKKGANLNSLKTSISSCFFFCTKNWPGKKVTIYFPIFNLVKSSENILLFYLHFT